MTIYTYNNIVTAPTLSGEILFDSRIGDKPLEYIKWEQENATLKIAFTTALSTEDKAILDGLVADNT